MTTCVPAAGGVPGLPDPPDWLTSHLPPDPSNLHRDQLDDPRWRGAAAQGFPLLGGTSEHLSFRALYRTDSPTESRLFLSWNVKVDPHPSDQKRDKLYVGLRAPGAGGAMVIEITPYGSSAPAKINEPAFGISAVQRSPGGWTTIVEPAWINTTTRIWLTVSPAPSWAVQMVFPIKSGGGLTDAAGPTLSDTFGLWYFAQVWTQGGYIPYEWKPGSAATAPGAIVAGAYPDPATWDTFHLSSGPSDAACPTGGIALRYLDVGTTNAPSHHIEKTGTNTFFVRPRNHSPSAVPVENMTARFRIANWGSVADPNAPWVDIPGGGAVPNSTSIPSITAGTEPPATNPIQFAWALTPTDIATFITGKSDHKCLLVELAGPGLTLLNSSVYRNMDAVSASTFRREAEISVVGLAAISPAPRNVYVYVDTQNMPAKIEPEDKPRTATVSRDARKLQTDEASRIEPTVEEQLASLPTYRVHVYHDTGATVTVDGAAGPVLTPQSSFGYYVSHSGALTGWRHQLTAPPEAQLQEISPNFYKIVVPNDGSVRVVTEIEAVEPGPGAALGGCWKRILAALGFGTVGATLMWRLRA